MKLQVKMGLKLLPARRGPHVRLCVSILLGLVACAGMVSFAREARAGERLAYAVVSKASDFTAAKTEIFCIDPDTSEKELLFSDANTSIILLQRLYVFHFPVAGGGRLFAHAAHRSAFVPFPGNDSLWELSVDGSNDFRRMTHVLGGESLGDLFVNSTGTRIGYINVMDRKQYILIHDVASGKLLNQVDITDMFLDCYASSIGWLPESERLYVSLEIGDVHITSEASYARVGTYLMDEHGEHVVKLSELPPRKGYFPPETVRMIGMLPGGEYVFETMQGRVHPSGEQSRSLFAVVKAARDFSMIEDMSFSPATGLYSGIRVSYRLSPSGTYLSAAGLPISSSAVSCDLWLKNLQTGLERNILSLPTQGLQGPFLGLVGWIDH
ncbi:hypothetical protein ACFL0Q_09435 [Thermodesulfobacteriota bacterium]